MLVKTRQYLFITVLLVILLLISDNFFASTASGKSKARLSQQLPLNWLGVAQDNGVEGSLLLFTPDRLLLLGYQKNNRGLSLTATRDTRYDTMLPDATGSRDLGTPQQIKRAIMYSYRQYFTPPQTVDELVSLEKSTDQDITDKTTTPQSEQVKYYDPQVDITITITEPHTGQDNNREIIQP